MSDGERDPFTTAVIANALDAIVEQMGITLWRSAYSPLIRDALDFATSLCDRDGRLLAQGHGIPMNIAAVGGALRALDTAFENRWVPGDVGVLNDPAHGGTHLNDVFLAAPVFDGADHVAFVVVVAHHTDVGGLVPGSMSHEATEIYQEGLRLTPLKLRRGGSVDRLLLEMIRANVRHPDQLLGDLEAMVAACGIGAREFLALLERFGRERAWAHIREVLDRTEEETRRAIARIPPGHYAFVDYLDDDGTGGGAVPIRVSIDVHADRIAVDFGGSAGQVRGSLNAPLVFTRSCALAALKCGLPADIGVNEGFLRCFEVTAPEGTLVNARPHAAVGHRGLTGYRVFDAVLGALAEAVPDRIRAAGEGGTLSCGFEGTDAHGRRFLFRQAFLGAWGGGPASDGIDGVTNPVANLANPSLEVLESRYPVTYEWYGFVRDSGGPGRHRGGLALGVRIRADFPEGTVNVRSDRRSHPPYGLAGGAAGQPSSMELVRDGRGIVLPAKTIQPLQRNDRIQMQLPGAGGYGNADARDPVAVLADVLDDKVSVQAARATYGVVIDLDQRAVRHEETAALRAARAQPVR